MLLLYSFAKAVKFLMELNYFSVTDASLTL